MTTLAIDRRDTERNRSANLYVREGSTERSVIFPLSSEEPYKRYYYSVRNYLDEILVHTDEAVDLSFLNSGNAPLLNTHNRWDLTDQIGVIRRAWLQEKRLYVEVEFGMSQRAEEVYQDVKAGVIRNVSVAYSVDRYEIDEEAETYRVTRWKPSEGSFVPIPADPTVGIGRSAAGGTNKESRMTTRTQERPPATGAELPPGLGGDTRSEEDIAKAMEDAINEVSALAAEHNMADVGREYILGCVRSGEKPSLVVFRGIVASKIPDGTPLRSEEIGLTDNQKQDFSIIKLCRYMLDENYDGAEFEREASRAAREKAGDVGRKTVGRFTIPTDVMNSWGSYRVDGVHSDVFRSSRARQQLNEIIQRAAFGTGTATADNILTTDHLAERFIDNLRNESAVLGAGATLLQGLDSNVEIPGGDANIAAAWLASEDADVTESNPSFREVVLQPHDLGAYTDVTRRMLQQSTIAFEAYVRSQLITAHRIAIDLAALYGSGLTGVPEGLANITGIGSVTFTNAIPTRGEVIDLRTDVASNNRGSGGSYLGNSEMVGSLQKTRTDAGSGLFLMNDSADRLVGNAFKESNQVTGGDLWYGYWEDLVIGMWGGLDLDRSTEAKFLSGGIRLRSIQTVDSNALRVGSFALGNDG